MYLKSQFERFADTIENKHQKEDFMKIVNSIRFDADGLCTDNLKRFEGTSVENDAKKFKADHIHYLSQGELDRVRNPDPDTEDGSLHQSQKANDSGVVDYE